VLNQYTVGRLGCLQFPIERCREFHQGFYLRIHTKHVRKAREIEEILATLPRAVNTFKLGD
jgi:hypothetical protein